MMYDGLIFDDVIFDAIDVSFEGCQFSDLHGMG